MVAKINSGNSIYGVLSYNQIKVDEDHAKVIFAGRMIENADGKFDMHTCLKSFEPYLLANRRTEKPVLHISINPDPKDKLSDEQLSEIAQIYMQKMGYGDQPLIVYKHEDIERKHIHIVSLRVDENGKKIDHNFERRRSMDICRELEQKYGLVPADRKQRQEGLPLKPVRYEDGDVKHQIANVIRSVARDYHFLSLKEYGALLGLYNTGVEEVRGEIKGKAYRGLVYSALNGRGEKIGNPFKSSLFGKSVGLEALEKRIEKSAEIIKTKGLKERSKKVVSAALQTTNNRAEFEKALAKQNISVLFRENEQGRIYGATFIDHEQKAVFNGSRLGKEFSANVFNDLFNGKSLKPDFHDFKTDMIEANQKSEKSFNQENQGSDLGGIFDLFMPENPAGDEVEEQNPTR
ncbi:MAG: relaxase/mobilization nuclease domain-containing protein, partial [Bacteroidales bacterium]|nr:relaxase/mobilization nuclease domain-containing protein [Bacteroidales bacterium]